MCYLTIILWSAAILSLSNEQEFDFVVSPGNQTVAANSIARFDCVVSAVGSVAADTTHIAWEVNEHKLVMNMQPPANSRYSAEWYAELNSTLFFSTTMGDNSTKIACIAATTNRHQRRDAILFIAGPPTKPRNFSAQFISDQNMLNFEWQHPLSISPTFPVLTYAATLSCSNTGKKLLQPILIDGTRTSYTLFLNESEVCGCDSLNIDLLATNKIGDSRNVRTVTSVLKDYEPFPINTSFTQQADRRVLVQVQYQRPLCFPQGEQISIDVQEVHPRQEILPPQFLLQDDIRDIVERFTMVSMKPHTMYSVVIHLSAGKRNASSLPRIVTLPVSGAYSGKGKENGRMILIIAATIGAVLLLLVTAIGVIICSVVLMNLHKKRKRERYIFNKCMQPNPIYEGPLYETISEASASLGLSTTTLNECQQTTDISAPSVKPQLCAVQPLTCNRESSTNMNEYMTHTHGVEDDYMVMGPASNSPVQ